MINFFKKVIDYFSGKRKVIHESSDIKIILDSPATNNEFGHLTIYSNTELTEDEIVELVKKNISKIFIGGCDE